jgi:D-alanyl-D-alanine carboxypeptidase
VSAATAGSPAPSARAHALPPSGGAVVANAQRQARASGSQGNGASSGDLSGELQREAPPVAPPISSDPVMPGELQATLDDWFAKSGLRGVTVAVRKPGQPVWVGVDGTDSETGGAMTRDKQFNITSMTKAFTSALVMQLVQEGSVGLDDKLSKYVPKSYFSHAGQVTIRELLMHTAGVDPGEGSVPPDDLSQASKRPLQFKPGTKWEYSSTGIMLLGLVVEKVTGQTYTEVVHQRITSPLGLDSTFMDDEIDGPQKHRRSTHPYRDHGNRSYHGTRWATGGLYSTVGDLTAFAQGLFDGGLLAPDTLAAMTDFDPHAGFYGLGIHAYCPCWLKDGRVRGAGWGHYGGYGLFEYDPNHQVAIAIYPDPTYEENEATSTAFDNLATRLFDVVRGRSLAAG